MWFEKRLANLWFYSVFSLIAFAGISASGDLVVQMDFNDADGVPTLVNSGSAGVTGELFNATLVQEAPAVNNGGYCVRFEPTLKDDSAQFPYYNYTNYVNMGNIAALDGLDQLTVATWVKIDEPRPCRIVSKSFVNWDYQLDTSGYQYVCIESVTKGGGKTVGSSWKYIAFTYDGTLTTNNIIFYKGDGYLLETILTNTIDKGTITSGTKPIWIGDSSGHDGGRPFSGWMDNVRIYDEVLSPAALAEAMKENDSPNLPARGPVIQLDFNDQDGMASLINHGTVCVTGVFHGAQAAYGVDVAPVNQEGPDGYSGAFSFIDNTTEDRNYVDLGDIDEIDSIPALTICTWLRGTADQGSAVTRLAGKGWNIEFALNKADSVTQTYRPELKINGSLADGAAIPITNEWVFVAITFNGALSSDNTVYYTGAGDLITKVVTNTIASSGTIASASPLYVGDWNGAGGSRAFTGYLDNFRIYDRVLDAEEIQSVMLVNDSPPAPGTIIMIQ